jgi:hypothetical protein
MGRCNVDLMVLGYYMGGCVLELLGVGNCKDWCGVDQWSG